jgi:microcystin-dependent protein
MRRFISSILLLTAIFCVDPRAAIAQSATPYVGQIGIFAMNFCPVGWSTAQGQLLPINQNQALFSLLGTTYGGDGMTTFALPQWGPIYSANGGAMIVCIALVGVYPSRS